MPPQQSELLLAALQKAGIESKLQIIDGARRGGPQFSTSEVGQTETAFFERHLKGGGAPAVEAKKAE